MTEVHRQVRRYMIIMNLVFLSIGSVDQTNSKMSQVNADGGLRRESKDEHPCSDRSW